MACPAYRLTGKNLHYSHVTVPFELDYLLCWAEGPVKYLGIWLSRDVQELWNMNIGRTITWLEGKINQWSILPLTLAGRIAVAKMVVLPKCLYIFVNVPLILTQSFLHIFRSLMISLVWEGVWPGLLGRC